MLHRYGVFFVAHNKNDEMHLNATAALTSSVLGWFGKAYTSSYVIDETLTLAKAKLGGPEARRLAESILQSKKITRVNVDEEESTFQDSFARFKEHLDVRGLSFTDCTTLVLSERLKIGTLVSFDSGFRPFVPMLLGEGYYRSLPRERRDLLAKIAQKLGIKLKSPKP